MVDQKQPYAAPVRSNGASPPFTPAGVAAPTDWAATPAQRYKVVRQFFLQSALHLLWWDVLLALPGLRMFRTPPIPRWQRMAVRYRALALAAGGMLIKLGQFLSIRVDLLPTEVLNELADMQDELPPEPLETIIALIEADLQQPLDRLFARLVPHPIGAASLAQVHRAFLPSGEEVVVKVLRPNIEHLIEMDLHALSQALRWLKSSARVRKQYDLDQLVQEFTTVTRNELDLHAEANNIERFAADFANDPQVYFPRIYRQYSGSRTLTMEHVGYIKIMDFPRLEAAGIDRSAVANQVFTLYLRQFFVTNFVHADPHPGNVFVKPLPVPDELARGIVAFAPADSVPHQPDRPFQIVLVDFGMVTTIPKQLQEGMREYIIGIGTQDARRVVQSFVRGGMLPPNADLERMEKAYQAIFDRFGGGYLLGHINKIDIRELTEMSREYNDLAKTSPVQMRADMIFVFRAMGLLSGLTTYLDPDFDAGKAAAPFAEQLLQQSVQEHVQTWIRNAVSTMRMVMTTPLQMGQFIADVREGNLSLQTALVAQDRQMLAELKQSVNGLTVVVIVVGAGIAGVIWRVGNALVRYIEKGSR